MVDSGIPGLLRQMCFGPTPSADATDAQRLPFRDYTQGKVAPVGYYAARVEADTVRDYNCDFVRRIPLSLARVDYRSCNARKSVDRNRRRTAREVR